MGKAKTNTDYARDAAEALKDLNMVYAIKAMCKNSLFSTPCHRFEARILKVCGKEAERCLRRYDHAMACIFEPENGVPAHAVKPPPSESGERR